MLWVTLKFEDGTEEDVNMDLVIRYKRNRNDGKKTVLFDVYGQTHWVEDTVEEIRKKRDTQYSNQYKPL